MARVLGRGSGVLLRLGGVVSIFYSCVFAVFVYLYFSFLAVCPALLAFFFPGLSDFSLSPPFFLNTSVFSVCIFCVFYAVFRVCVFVSFFSFFAPFLLCNSFL